MQITKCPTCQGKVSSAAPTCPHCGHPFQPPQKSVARGVFWGLFLFFIVLPIAVFLGFIVIGAMGMAVPAFSKARSATREAKVKAQAEAENREYERKDAEAREQLRLEREAYQRSPARIAERETQDAERRDNARIEAEAKATEAAQLKDLKERPARERAAKLIAYQLAQASNGLPSFQLEIGRRYLRGDGVPVDAVLARHWLQSAATNGETEARRLLETQRK